MLCQRMIESRVVMVDRVTRPPANVPDFLAQAAEVPVLVFKWLLEHHGLRIAAVRERLATRLATPGDLRLLNLPEDDVGALLDIDAVSCDSMNRPLVATRPAALTEDHCHINEIR